MFKRVVHPGEVLRDELAEMGVSWTTFARELPCRRIVSNRSLPGSAP